MSTGGYATPAQYETMIQALQQFEQSVMNSTEAMQKCGQLCTAAMGSDEISTNAVANLEKSIVAYHEVLTKSANLRKALARDLERVQELIRRSREMEGE